MHEDEDPERWREFVADIREHGLEQPLIVTPFGDKYRIVVGHRRWRAAREAGLLEVPCQVRPMIEAHEVETMVRENLHRNETTPLEEGRMFATMAEALGLSIGEVANRVGKSTSYVAVRLAVVLGHADVREALRLGHINLTVAQELNRVTHDADRAYLLHWAITGGATGSTVRGWVNEKLLMRATQPEAPPAPGAAEAYGTMPLSMGICEWHQGQVPLDGLVGIRVCVPCYTQLELIRKRLEEAGQAEGGETHGILPAGAEQGAPRGHGGD